jgi:hypothetical protein
VNFLILSNLHAVLRNAPDQRNVLPQWALSETSRNDFKPPSTAYWTSLPD